MLPHIATLRLWQGLLHGALLLKAQIDPPRRD